MRTLIFLAVVAALAYGAYVLWQRSQRPASGASGRAGTPPADPLERHLVIDPRRLKVGDIIAYAGKDHLVRGSVSFDQDGDTWWEHHLDAGDGQRLWLSVEDAEDGLETVLWRAVLAPELTPETRVTHDGVSYARAETGRATYTSTGTTGLPATGTVEYHDYASTTSADRRLSFERFGSDSYEVGLGEVVSPESLDIYPVTPGADGA